MNNYILGNSGHALEIQALIKLIKSESSIFLDLQQELNLNMNPVVDTFHIGVGIPRNRLEIVLRYQNSLEFLATLIHPNSFIDESAVIGQGVVVQSGSVISVNAELGHGVLVNWNSTVGHETSIGEGSVVNPNASISGNCRIGKGVLIGSGAVVLAGLEIGDNSIIGAGAVVTKSVPPGITSMGVPSRMRS